MSNVFRCFVGFSRVINVALSPVFVTLYCGYATAYPRIRIEASIPMGGRKPVSPRNIRRLLCFGEARGQAVSTLPQNNRAQTCPPPFERTSGGCCGPGESRC